MGASPPLNARAATAAPAPHAGAGISLADLRVCSRMMVYATEELLKLTRMQEQVDT